MLWSFFSRLLQILNPPPALTSSPPAAGPPQPGKASDWSAEASKQVGGESITVEFMMFDVETKKNSHYWKSAMN